MDRLFSGIQSTGNLTIGNYLGAMRNFVKLQEKYECYFMIADLHTLSSTKKILAEDLIKNTKELLALYLAIGLDPTKSTIFLQSQLSTHTFLQWILTTMTSMGELSRMTQYKDKSQKAIDEKKNINVGIFMYPVLMASDILLYDAKYVPVGDDQKQHIEITRDLAQRFNSEYGKTFLIPEAIIPKASRIKGLQYPDKKMSKSNSNPNDAIFLTDSDEEILKKVKRAITDSEGKIYYDVENKAGISNLLVIYSELSDISIEEAEKLFENSNYGEFKNAVAQKIIDVIGPIRDKAKKIFEDDEYLNLVLEQGRKKADFITTAKIIAIKKKIGLL